MRMPQENIDVAMFAPCGMNCMVCYKHCRRKDPCAGCLRGDIGKPEHCRRCKIKECIRQKEHAYCFQCSDFPCKPIKNLATGYKKRYGISLAENSEFVRQYGLERFMASQKEKYTCAKCGDVVSVHDGECSECREKAK